MYSIISFVIDVRIGAYANGFKTTTSEWLKGSSNCKCNSDEKAKLVVRESEYDDEDIMRCEAYTQYAMEWIKNGATIIGGCCGILPQHIIYINKELGRSVIP